MPTTTFTLVLLANEAHNEPTPQQETTAEDTDNIKRHYQTCPHRIKCDVLPILDNRIKNLAEGYPHR